MDSISFKESDQFFFFFLGGGAILYHCLSTPSLLALGIEDEEISFGICANTLTYGLKSALLSKQRLLCTYYRASCQLRTPSGVRYNKVGAYC